MNKGLMYPLRFEPIYQYRVWGGRRLAKLLKPPLPRDGPVGEAWLLSDRDDHASKVAAGPLEGSSLAELLARFPDELMGKLAGRFRRFPLLLKFLDAQEKLSVQVHPTDRQKQYLPAGETGKTEAWVVIESGPESQIYAGLKPGTTRADLERVLANRTVADLLSSFTPKPDDAVLIEAGTVHSLSGVVVFEVQENSDVTFRLYDWDRVDPKTGRKRALQVEQAIECVDFTQTAIGPVKPVVEAPPPASRERLFDCDQFKLWRHRGRSAFSVGAADSPRVLVCLGGAGDVQYGGTSDRIEHGDVVLLPAALGACLFQPSNATTLLEIAPPE